MSMDVTRFDDLTIHVGRARALTRAIVHDVLDDGDKGWLESLLLKELETAHAILHGKGGE